MTSQDTLATGEEITTKEAMLAQLEDRAVIAVSGPEARSFLQGLITNDIEKLSPRSGLYAALLTPQGKVLFDFLVVEGDGAILIDCTATSRDALVKRLSMYRLRAKVAIETRDQLAVLAARDGTVSANAIAFADPRLVDLGVRGISACAEIPSSAAASDAYHAWRLELGVPEGDDFGSDRIFALDAALEELHAIDFDKGCYVGQELTARMKHRGTARKRLLPIVSTDGAPLAARDASVTAAGRDIGEIASTHGSRGFALVRLDRLAEAGNATLEAGGRAVIVRKPAWLFP
jgi:folate-binding protein YgfZ